MLQCVNLKGTHSHLFLNFYWWLGSFKVICLVILYELWFAWVHGRLYAERYWFLEGVAYKILQSILNLWCGNYNQTQSCVWSCFVIWKFSFSFFGIWFSSQMPFMLGMQEDRKAFFYRPLIYGFMCISHHCYMFNSLLVNKFFSLINK